MSKWLAIVFALLVSAAVAHADAAPRKISVTVTEKGFVPDDIKVKAGEKVILVFTRKSDKTCARDVVIKVSDNQKIEQKLPLDKAVEVPVTFAKPGKVTFSCSMDMVSGLVTVQ